MSSNRLKIGIDISQIVYTGSGVARFTQGLVNAILQYDTSNEWIFFFSSLRQKLDVSLKNSIKDKGHTLITYPFPPTLLSLANNNLHSISHILPTTYSLPPQTDWFITSDWTEPKLPCKKATIVHDLVVHRFPETVHPTILKTQLKRLKIVSKESDLIFADSESTASDLKEIYDVSGSRIKVNYPGVSHVTDDKTRPTKEIIDKYDLHKPYILTVGKQEPRKNLEKLISAFKKTTTTAQLVIVGSHGWGDKHVAGHSHDIKFLGFVPDEDLTQLYRNASFFVYPSLYEGFGYPVIESMLAGCPVATSNNSSLGEIAGDAAIVFNPHREDEISNAIQKLFDNEQLRKELAKKGTERAKLYTWERYYNKLITELEKRS